MIKHLYVFKNPTWAKAKRKFTHYWTNEGDNFFDTVIQEKTLIPSISGENLFNARTSETEVPFGSDPTEQYLKQFMVSTAEGDEGYRWVELPITRYQRQDLTTLNVQMSAEDFIDTPMLFFKLTNEDEVSHMEVDIPIYYYSESIIEVSDQNYDSTSYTVRCKLDMWATFWCRMHSAMKECNTDVDFMKKMAGRFLFNEQFNLDGTRKDSKGFIVDYLQQPYLMRTGEYSYPLIENDEIENFLTLEEWLFLNSGKKDVQSLENWVAETWLKWLDDSWVGVFSPLTNVSETQEYGTEPSFSPEDIGKLQNFWAVRLTDGFYDTDYNSNSKYRYLVCKVGNNTPAKESDWDKETKTYKHVKGMFKNFDNGYRYAVGKTLVQAESGIDQNQKMVETEPWSEFGPGSYEYTHTVQLKDVSISDTGSVSIYWDDFLINEKFLRFRFESIYDDVTYTNYVTWTNDLQLKKHRTILPSVSLHKEYPIIDLPTKSYLFDVWGDYVDVTLKVSIMFDSLTDAKLVFRLSLDTSFEPESHPEIKVYFSDTSYAIKSLYIVSGDPKETMVITSQTSGNVIDGETLMIVPFKKGVYEREYIEWFNSTDKGILMGDGSIQGMPINDIPPSVLALAIRRQNDESDYQNIGDALSIRHAEGINCPISLIDFKLGDNDVPVMFSNFDNIPIVIASAPIKDNIYQCVGGNKFFNYLYDILTNGFLTNNTYNPDGSLYHGGNQRTVEPYLFTPQFWKWVYYIDASHSIELTAEKIDYAKFISTNWEVKLNVNLNSVSTYFLDISDIKNNKYPMSKLGVELISGDPASYPYTTEAYNNWLQNNQWTQETSKNAVEIQNKYARTGAKISAITTGIATAAEGVISGVQGGGLFAKAAGAAIGGTAGAIAGAAKATGIIMGTENAIQQANAEWDNKWKGELGNYYNSPSILNPSGFSSGSLTYSTIKGANQNSYELFRTFSLSDVDAEQVWHDVSMNGYPYISQCMYKDYNNRVNFNVVNCNLYGKYFLVANYLKSKMFDISPLMSQADAINSFMDKCKGMFRVFKCEYDPDNLDDIISTNIELVREWVEPYYPDSRLVFIPANKKVEDNPLTTWDWAAEYYIDGNKVIKNEPNSMTLRVSYSDLGVSTWNDFLSKYSNIALGNRGTNAKLSANDVVLVDSISINTSDYGPGELLLPEEVNKYIDSLTTNTDLNTAIYVTKNGKNIPSKQYTLGWIIDINAHDSTGITVDLNPQSYWTFDEDVSDGVIHNKKVSEERFERKYSLNKKFDRTFDWEEQRFFIYHDGEWKNDFKPTGKSDIIYYTPYSKGNMSALHPMNERTVCEEVIPYGSINPKISTKADFLNYYKQMTFDVSSWITYSYAWPVSEVQQSHKLDGTLNLKINVTPGTYEYSGDRNLICIGKADNANMPSEWRLDWVKKDDSDATAEAIAGCVEGGKRDSGSMPREWVNAENAIFSTRIHYNMKVEDDGLHILIQDTSFAAQYSRYKNEYYGIKSATYYKYGRVLEEKINWIPNKMYAALGRDSNFRGLGSNITAEKVTFTPREQEYVTKWYMENILNDVVFVKKGNDTHQISNIMKNKK